MGTTLLSARSATQHGLSFTLKPWGGYLPCMSIIYAWALPEAISTTMHDFCHLWLSSLPSQSITVNLGSLQKQVAMHGLIWVVFTPMPTIQCRGSSSLSLFAKLTCGHGWSTFVPVDLFEIFEFAHLKFTVGGWSKPANKQTYTCVHNIVLGLTQTHTNKG